MDDQLKIRSGQNHGMAHIEQRLNWALMARLPMCIAAAIPMPGFKVKHLLELRQGQVFESRVPSSTDVPVTVGEAPFGWVEFEVVEQKMAVRLTRLA